MPDQNQGERRWIVEPSPASGEVTLYMACGEGVELTEEQEAALSALLRSLEAADADVTGFATPECPSYGGSCSDINWCEKLRCGAVNCKDLICMPLSKAAGRSGSAWTLTGSFLGPR